MSDNRGGELIGLPVREAAASADAVFDDMLSGWGKQQLSRNFKVDTIRTRGCLVRRFVDHSGHFPWKWDLADVDDFFAHARAISNLSFSTVRSYQRGSPNSGWQPTCKDAYDSHAHDQRLP